MSRRKKTALEAFVGMHEGLWTYLYDGTFTHMHFFFFCFLSEHHVTSGWGGQAGGHGLLDVIRLISPILTVNLMAKEQILLLLCSCQTSF